MFPLGLLRALARASWNNGMVLAMAFAPVAFGPLWCHRLWRSAWEPIEGVGGVFTFGLGGRACF